MIDQTSVVDMVFNDDKEVFLIITDHLPWTNETNYEHASKLQDKFNTHIAFVESGEMVERFPQYSGKKVVIRVIGKYPLSDQAKEFYKLASKVAESGGFRLEFKLSEV